MAWNDFILITPIYILLGLLYCCVLKLIDVECSPIVVVIWPLSVISTILYLAFRLFDKEEEEEEDVDVSCNDCRYRMTSSNAYPCKYCRDFSRFVRGN